MRSLLERSRQAGNGFDDPSSRAGLFRDLGIGRQTRVLLLVGGASPAGPSAVWFSLQRLGFPNASVVNGGFAALKDALAGTGSPPVLSTLPRPRRSRSSPPRSRTS